MPIIDRVGEVHLIVLPFSCSLPIQSHDGNPELENSFESVKLEAIRSFKQWS